MLMPAAWSWPMRIFLTMSPSSPMVPAAKMRVHLTARELLLI